MKHQQVSVDYWAMGKAMLTYGALTVAVWVMLRLFNAVFMLPRRLRSQQEQMQNTLMELQKRYPDLNITEEDLKNADKEFDEFMKEGFNDKLEKKDKTAEEPKEPPAIEEDKKDI